MPQTDTCLHFLVSGHVQGVGFRAATQAEARRLGLTGWVANNSDGSVELVACGARSQLGQLKRWLHQGPRLARVEHVLASPSRDERFERFDIWR